MKGKKVKYKKKKFEDQKGQRPNLMGHKRAWPFDRKKESTNILLQKVRRRHTFEETKKTKDKSTELAQIWDEDLCE